MFLIQLAIKWPLMFPSYQTSISALPGENKTHNTVAKMIRSTENIPDIIDSNLKRGN